MDLPQARLHPGAAGEVSTGTQSRGSSALAPKVVAVWSRSPVKQTG